MPFHVSPDRADVYLTYDDGPNPGITEHVLDVLDAYAAKASFFVLGRSVGLPGAGAILRRAVASGHTIGNHGFVHTHDDPQFEAMEAVLQRELGTTPAFVRPPFGDRATVERFLEQRPAAIPVYWDLGFRDYESIDLVAAAAKMREELRPGTIVLLHDGVPENESDVGDPPVRRQSIVLTELLLAECRRKWLTPRALEYALATQSVPATGTLAAADADRSSL